MRFRFRVRFNPKIPPPATPAGALLHCSPTFAPSSQRTALSVRGFATLFADLCSFVAKDGLSVDDLLPLG